MHQLTALLRRRDDELAKAKEREARLRAKVVELSEIIADIKASPPPPRPTPNLPLLMPPKLLSGEARDAAGNIQKRDPKHSKAISGIMFTVAASVRFVERSFHCGDWRMGQKSKYLECFNPIAHS